MSVLRLSADRSRGCWVDLFEGIHRRLAHVDVGVFERLDQVNSWTRLRSRQFDHTPQPMSGVIANATATSLRTMGARTLFESDMKK